MRQGITTKYHGPSNVKGSRIKAVARRADRDRGWKEMSHTQSYQYGSSDEEHTSAAKALATKLGWSGLWVAGGKPEEDGNMYVSLPLYFVTEAGNIPGTEGKDWFIVEEVKA